ncbi:hypothetical protein BC643_1576 [Mangrovibacterium diazotrophicum]|uniref:Uncharacterized protein n=1 Tax=Mangrovibacterium diazotrophicum TaxID=1261403 RepID=A0A419W6Y3_9BACT|nr:hypothetical protein BC643_1576 [Mangrovibacterium diazotrophicum]
MTFVCFLGKVDLRLLGNKKASVSGGLRSIELINLIEYVAHLLKEVSVA